MAGSVKGPGDNMKPVGPSNEPPKQFETGMGKAYTTQKAPEFKKWLSKWFGGNVTPQMVSAFEQNMMRMIQNSMKESKAQHKKVMAEVKRRIKGG